jgi:hypothetical protein
MTFSSIEERRPITGLTLISVIAVIFREDSYREYSTAGFSTALRFGRNDEFVVRVTDMTLEIREVALAKS